MCCAQASLAQDAFGEGTFEARTYGNVLSATGFLYGLASCDLRAEELDPACPVIVALRAVKQLSTTRPE